ncbi:MAG TPA: class F sortase [Candidatus Paceibacterota bacterium]
MQIVNINKKVFPLVIINSAVVFLATFLIMKNLAEKSRPETILPLISLESESEQTVKVQPIVMRIEKIGLDAPIVPVGKAASGSMAVPKGYDEIGWYKHGVSPGEVGNAVFAGHVDNGKGNPAIFSRLKDLTIGNTIEVENEDGQKILFKVTGMKLIPYNSEPQIEIFGPAKEARLNLITCDGTWIPRLKTYSDRLVVFTERVEQVESID